METPPPMAGRAAHLTSRQRQVLRLQAYGFSYDEISTQLGLSVWTVKNHHKQAVRSLQLSLTVLPCPRVRTALACYIIGLLDAGVPPIDIAGRLKKARDSYSLIAETDDSADEDEAEDLAAAS